MLYFLTRVFLWDLTQHLWLHEREKQRKQEKRKSELPDSATLIVAYTTLLDTMQRMFEKRCIRLVIHFINRYRRLDELFIYPYPQ